MGTQATEPSDVMTESLESAPSSSLIFVFSSVGAGLENDSERMLPVDQKYDLLINLTFY